MYHLTNKKGQISRMSLIELTLRTLYRVVSLAGLFSTNFGQWLYERSFFTYKFFLEGKTMDELFDFINPDSCLLDVGANVGLYTRHFLNYLDGKGKVIAVEPEQRNLRWLKKRFAESIDSGRLILIDKVVTKEPGTYYLKIDPFNPGAHVIAACGVPVRGTTIDQVVSECGVIPSLIKIDVEGYEEQAVLGAQNTIKNYHPVLFIEFHPALLSDCGSEPLGFLRYLSSQDYQFFLHNRKTGFYQASIDHVMARSEARHWVDLLVMQKNRFAKGKCTMPSRP